MQHTLRPFLFGGILAAMLAVPHAAKADEQFYIGLPKNPEAIYAAGEKTTATLSARDAAGHDVKPQKSFLKIIRPDDNFYAEQSVPDDNAAAHTLAVQLPETAETGIWSLMWQQADGKVLARVPLRLSADGTWPRFEVAADKTQLAPDETVTLNVKAVDSVSGKPLDWRRGAVTWREVRPELSAWKKYRFGKTADNPGDAKLATFATGADGTAEVKLKSPLPDDASVSAATLTVRLERFAEPVTLTLPTAPANGWIGIKSKTDSWAFAENSEAGFDVIALDPSGKRRAAPDDVGELHYKIYEEDRGFKWFPDDGRWNYQLLPQHRKLGGGKLELSANGEAHIEWPVTSGHYVLEIDDADDKILAETGFDAVWNPRGVSSNGAVEAIPTWGEGGAGGGVAISSVENTKKDSFQNQTTVFAEPPPSSQGGRASTALVVDAIPAHTTVGDKIDLVFRIANNGERNATYNYSVTLPAGMKSGQPIKESLQLKRGTSRSITLPIIADAETGGVIRLDVSGPNGLHETQDMPINARDYRRVPPQSLTRDIKPRQTVTLQNLGNRTIVSAIPLLDAPQGLYELIDSAPFTTTEIADALIALQAWRNEALTLGVENAANLQNLHDTWSRRLQRRQTPDGGFREYDDATTSDVKATSAALEALHDEAPQPSAIATVWLRRKLENTWFEEAERPARAAAFLALSVARSGDLSALRYFADTSRDKDLPAVAEAQIALALAQNHDEDAARFWLQRAQNHAGAAPSWRLLRLIAANPLVPLPDFIRDYSGIVLHDESIAQLQTVAALRSRSGAWRVVVNGADNSSSGLFVVPQSPDKKTALTMNNPSDQPLFVTQISSAERAAAKAAKIPPAFSVQKQLYRLDGARVADDESLTAGQTYLLALRVSGYAGNVASLRITVPTGTGLRPVALATGTPETTALWPWLAGQRAEVEHLAATSDAMTLEIKPDKNAAEWRAAFPVKALYRGRFSLPSLVAEASSGEPLPIAQTPLHVNVN